jgi:hypothetical protein
MRPVQKAQTIALPMAVESVGKTSARAIPGSFLFAREHTDRPRHRKWERRDGTLARTRLDLGVGATVRKSLSCRMRAATPGVITRDAAEKIVWVRSTAYNRRNYYCSDIEFSWGHNDCRTIQIRNALPRLWRAQRPSATSDPPLASAAAHSTNSVTPVLPWDTAAGSESPQPVQCDAIHHQRFAHAGTQRPLRSRALRQCPSS